MGYARTKIIPTKKFLNKKFDFIFYIKKNTKKMIFRRLFFSFLRIFTFIIDLLFKPLLIGNDSENED